MRWNTPQISATIWVELKSIMLSEKLRQRKTNIINLSYMWRNREQISGYQRQVAGDGRNTRMVCLNKLSFKRKKSFKRGKMKKKKSKEHAWFLNIQSVQFSHSFVSNSLQPHGLQHARTPVHHQLPEFTQTHIH